MSKRTRAMATAMTLVVAAILTGNVSAATTPTPASLPKLTLALTKHSIKVSGNMRSGAVKVVMTVSQHHSEPTLIRLNPGVPFSAFAKAGAAINEHGGDFNYLDPYGSIVFDVVATHGTSSAQTSLLPGKYFAIDLASLNSSPTYAAFTVVQAAHPAALPRSAAMIKAIDFGFRGATRLQDGELVRFQNDGFLAHQIQGIRVRNAEAAKRLTADLRAGKDSQAKKLVVGLREFAGPLSPGGYQQERITQKPGVYVLVCIMRTQDGREESQLGMERTIHIVS